MRRVDRDHDHRRLRLHGGHRVDVVVGVVDVLDVVGEQEDRVVVEDHHVTLVAFLIGDLVGDGGLRTLVVLDHDVDAEAVGQRPLHEARGGVESAPLRGADEDADDAQA